MVDSLPCLLVMRKLVRPLEQTEAEVAKLTTRLQSADDMDTVLLQGLAVLGLSYLETGLADCLRYYLQHFPQKLKAEELKFTKDVFIQEQFELLEHAIDNFLQNAAYKNFEDYLGLATDVLSIQAAIPAATLSSMREFRARRNLLLHAALEVNDRYLASAGPLENPPRRGARLDMKRDYVVKALGAVADLLATIRTTLEVKYQSYTKIRAARDLWAFLFQSPVMRFEDFWHLDEAKDKIFAYKKVEHESALSGTEQLMLALWRSHFGGRDQIVQGFHMRRFDDTRRTKVLYFLMWASDFDFD